MKHIFYFIAILLTIASCVGAKSTEKIDAKIMTDHDSLNMVHFDQDLQIDTTKLSSMKIKIVKVNFFEPSTGEDPSPIPPKAKKDRPIKSVEYIQIESEEKDSGVTNIRTSVKDSSKVTEHSDVDVKSEVKKKPEDPRKAKWIAIILVIGLGTFAFFVKKHRDE